MKSHNFFIERFHDAKPGLVAVFRGLKYKGLLTNILIFYSFFCPLTFAVTQEIYSFNSLQKKLRFQQITQELRCVVCQNQNLSDSNARLAKDLRQIIYQRVKSGESTQSIKRYLVSRYGEFVLLKPIFSPLTYSLWLTPYVLLLSILLKLLLRIKRTVHIVSGNNETTTAKCFTDD